jgi:C4-dicarboxylate-specific signal transduction histidine kinase
MPAIDQTSRNYLNELSKVRAELERRVEQRTAQLAAANEVLIQEIQERKQIETALRESEELSRPLRACPLTIT